MENTAELFLAALRGALLGEKVNMEGVSRDTWRALLKLAEMHKVLPLIFQAIYDNPSLGNLEEDERMLLKRRVRHQVVQQTLRTGEFLELNRALVAAEVTPLVVKGVVCRQLYPMPDHRPSSDEDVLIQEPQFDLCRRVMEEWGMKPGQEDPDAYEIPFRKPESPLYIELHKHLFPPESAAYGDLNRFFEGVFDRAVELEVPGGRVRTLAPTDHMFYLICHAFKHFLHSGFGIRQVCDIVLFAREYRDRVDWQRVSESCEAIRGAKFAAAVFRMGEKHLGIESPEVFRNTDVDEMPMLEDLLRGGLYGDATLSRKHSSSITLEAVSAQKQGKRAKGSLRTSVFPTAEALSGKYPYLKEKPWLLPLAWGQRIWKYSRETRMRSDSSAAEALKIGADRVELMKIYEII